VSGKPHRGETGARGARERSTAKRIFGGKVAAGAAAYLRERDLPKLIALWPHELDDHSQGGSLNVLAKLRRALAGHWSYDLNRHLGLLSAYRGELARFSRGRLKAQPNCTRRGSDLGCG
jgi:hypothetical protein